MKTQTLNGGAPSVLVTGAAGGLGQVVVGKILASGHSVIASARTPQAETENLSWVPMDLSSADDVARGVGEVVAKTGSRPLRGVVHCAGGFRFGKLDSLTSADIDFLIDANLRSTLYLLKELLPVMKEGGRIVLIGAHAARDPFAGVSAYLATKGALEVLARTVNLEYREKKIAVKVLAPSIIDTPKNRADMPDADFSTWVSPDTLAQAAMEFVQKPWVEAMNEEVITSFTGGK